jgi:hypothetical protein
MSSRLDTECSEPFRQVDAKTAAIFQRSRWGRNNSAVQWSCRRLDVIFYTAA